jgi:hypothetical protein
MAKTMLALLGAPYSSRMVYAVIAWVLSETGRTIVGNNPWNQHAGPPCPKDAPAGVRGIAHSQRLAGDRQGLIGNRYAGPGDQNVAIYKTMSDGLWSSASNLLSGLTAARKWTGYGAVVRTARANDPGGFLAALAKSSWAADRYGTKGSGPNRLVKVYDELVADLGDWYQI